MLRHEFTGEEVKVPDGVVARLCFARDGQGFFVCVGTDAKVWCRDLFSSNLCSLGGDLVVVEGLTPSRVRPAERPTPTEWYPSLPAWPQSSWKVWDLHFYTNG